MNRSWKSLPRWTMALARIESKKVLVPALRVVAGQVVIHWARWLLHRMHVM